MACKRCGGFMVVELSSDLMEEDSLTGIDPTRCVNCGNIEDAIICANRATPSLPSQAQSRTGIARGPRIARASWIRQGI